MDNKQVTAEWIAQQLREMREKATKAPWEWRGPTSSNTDAPTGAESEEEHA